MSLENIREKLIEKKLSTLEYFILAFEAFKNFWKENTLMMVSIFAFIIASIIIKIVNLTLDEELLVYFRASKIMILWAKIFNVLDVIISIASIFVTVYFFRKVALTIEGNKKNLKLKELFSKASVLVVIFFVAGIIRNRMENSIVGVIFLIIFSIVSFCIAIWAFWYFEAYYIRNFGLMESIDYSLNLSDGNRIRKFLPGLIIALGILIFNIMTNIFFNILNIENFVANLIIIFIFVMILSLFVMYLQILDIIVFLNVEYDYLGENLNEELKFGIENNLNEKNQILDDNKNKNN
ncbi:hypothetical protein [Leptotrichia massiliensis]|uniref:hypothetical protein n=1 Tax=Leptotrichia massiliensis TaxID=1852388 RepID=UPI0008D97EDC|nr:hypothetical protein [Leptotrichia massiliensis]